MTTATAETRFGGPHTAARLTAPVEDGGYGLGDVAMSIREKCVKDPLYLASEVLSPPPMQPLLRNPCPEHRRSADAMIAQRDQMLLLPRGHLKTTLVDVVGSIWQGIVYPNDRQLILQASIPNAKMLSGVIRSHYSENPAFRALFPEYAMAGKEEHGSVLSFSFPCRTAFAPEMSIEVGAPGSSLSGRHYDVVRASDLMNEHTTPPPCGRGTIEEMVKTIDWYSSTISLREKRSINPRAHRTIDGTYWSDGDLYKEILRKDTDNQFEKIIAGITENADGTFVPVWELIGSSELRSIRHDPSMTTAAWAANYAMDPLPPETVTRFTRDMFRVYKSPPTLREISITVDAAWTEKQKNPRADRTAAVVSGLSADGDLFVLQVIAGRWGAAETIQKVWDLCCFWNPEWVGFEDITNSLKAMFYREMSLNKRFFKYRELKTGTRDKVTRAGPLHNHAQQRGLYVTQEMYDGDFVAEFLRFPSPGAHDDYVDAMAYRCFDIYAPAMRRAIGSPPELRSIPGRGADTGDDARRRRMARSRSLGEKPWTRVVRQLA